MAEELKERWHRNAPHLKASEDTEVLSKATVETVFEQARCVFMYVCLCEAMTCAGSCA